MEQTSQGAFSGAQSGAAAGSAGGPWGAAIGAVVGGTMGYMNAKKAKKKTEKRLKEAQARLEEARMAVQSSGEHAKSELAYESKAYQANVGQNLAERGLNASSAYDAAMNDAKDKENRARGEIDARMGGQLAAIGGKQADLLAGVEDIYDGQAVAQSLSSLGYSVGQLMDEKPTQGGGAGGGSGAQVSSNVSGSASMNVQSRQPSGAPRTLPGGGAPVDPYAFNSEAPMTPGRAGYTPAVGALPSSRRAAVTAGGGGAMGDSFQAYGVQPPQYASATRPRRPRRQGAGVGASAQSAYGFA